MKFPLIDGDTHDELLKSLVHPSDWENPTPSGTYNLVVIGGGSAGLVSAIGAAGLGAKVALIESHLLGGDCLNYGCVPSKALIRASRAIAAAKDLDVFGSSDVTVDFPAIMERMRSIRAEISHHDSAQRFQDAGVDVYLGHGRFTGSNTVEVAGKTLKFKKAVIATGAKAWVPPIDGIDEVEYLTNETVFTLTELPKRFAVIGAGPIGSELAQCFARFGSEVTVIEMANQTLGREDRDAAEIVKTQMERDGVTFMLEAKTNRIASSDDGIVMHVEHDGREQALTFDQVLFATGRRANLDSLDLDSAGVERHKHGLVVNDFLQTTNPDIYGAGDCCSKYQFTHTADAMARIVIQNSLFANTKRAGDLVIPWATYTEPEVAHVGMYEADAKEAGYETDVYKKSFADVDRAKLDGQTEGFLKVLTKKDTDQILGATLVGDHAGDLISEITVAMTNGVGLAGIANTIHPYPTNAEIIRKVGDDYNRTRLSPRIATIFEKFLSWRR